MARKTRTIRAPKPRYQVGQQVTADESILDYSSGRCVLRERYYTATVARRMLFRLYGGSWGWQYILVGDRGRTTWIDEGRLTIAA